MLLFKEGVKAAARMSLELCYCIIKIDYHLRVIFKDVLEYASQ